MAGQRARTSTNSTLALLRRDAERRAWLATSFQSEIPAAGDLNELGQLQARFAEIARCSGGSTPSGLPGRAFFGAHVHAILQEEPEPSDFSIGFIRIRSVRPLDASVLRPMAQILRESLRPEDHLAEVRPAVFGIIAPATTGAALENLLGEAALSIASTTFFDAQAGESKAYEAEVAMGRLDGRRTVEDVFRETRRSAVFDPAVIAGGRAAGRLLA